MQFDNLFKNKYAVIALNVASGAALLAATTWFSYNLFSSRDTVTPSPVAVTTTTTTTTETPVTTPVAPVVVVAPPAPVPAPSGRMSSAPPGQG